MKRLCVFTWIALGLTTGPGCVPIVEEDPSRVREGQILAIQFEPAEAEPKETASATALVVKASEASAVSVDFDLCLARKALSELGPVAPECVGTGVKDDKVATPLGSGSNVSFAVPEQACRLFGPQRPPAEPGQPPGRPADPDASGGYYQPVVARSDDTALGGLRLDCGLPGASQAQVAEYNRNHQDNVNPKSTSVKLRVGSGPWQEVPLDSDIALSLPRDSAIVIRAEWSAPDSYQILSPEDRQLKEQTENYLVSFYSTVGRFVNHRVIADSRERADAQWQSPESRERVDFWVIARDGRGGVGWATFVLDVE